MRLTRLRNDGQYLRNNKNIDECIKKLGQLEDIEEELGIDLITFFKALKNGVYYFTQGNQLTKDKVMVNNTNISVEYGKTSFCFVTYFEFELLYFKDYGKTWSLDKKDLEK